MRLFATPPYHDVKELLDSSDNYSKHDLTHTLRDIRRANIFGLGTWVVKHHLARLLADHPRDRPVRVLDLATGSADIPQAICHWADEAGYALQFVATDVSEPILGIARQRINKAGLASRVSFAVCDATRPPFPDGAFDVVVCSLAFHHLQIQQAKDVLGQMARLGKKGFIINDIYRAKGGWYMSILLSRLTTTNKLTRHDGPASVLRAFTPVELRRLAGRAGVAVRIYKHPFWRVAVVGRGTEERGA
jgi:ubiquinone/menaquinone biosynthesis C-methylase UbiE